MDPIPSCTCGMVARCTCQILKKLLDREAQAKLIQLLMGLNSSYEQMQTNLLSLEPLPPLNKALGILPKVEKQKAINDGGSELVIETTTYVSKNKFQGKSKPSSDKHFTHCNKPGHVIEDCHRLKTCDFCNVKGHILERCFKYKAFLAKLAKDKPAQDSNAKAVHNAQLVHSVHSQDDEYESLTDHPLIQSQGPSHLEASTSQSQTQVLGILEQQDVVKEIVDAVTQQVLKQISDNFGSGFSFAGQFK